MDESMKLINHFCNYIETSEGLSIETSRKYRGYLERLDAYCQGEELTMLAATYETLEYFTGIHMHKAGLQPSSRKIVVSCIRKFYDYLAKRKLIKSNPSKHLEHPKAGRRVGNQIHLKNFEKLLMQPGLGSFMAIRDTAIISILGGCGMRVSGLVNMNVSSLVFIQENDIERLIIKVNEKGDNERLIPAPDEVWAMVRAYLGCTELEDYNRLLPNGDQVLFVKSHDRNIPPSEFYGDNTRLSRKGIYRIIKKHGLAAGIREDQLHPHAVRHLFGTELTESDIDPTVRMTIMGQQDIKSQNIYNHMAMRKLRKDLDKGNPLNKIQTPVTDLVKELRKK